MADLLGATNPVPGYDNSITNNRNLPLSPDSTLVQNVPDPNRVVRPDGKTEQQDSSAQDGSLIRYDSNFQTFLQRLREAPGLAAGMLRLFAGREGTVVLSGLSEGIAKELSQALEMLRMDESQMMEFITGQVRSGTRFSGALFALLRGAYNRAGSEGVRQDILQFLRSYSDYSSTAHIEGNLLRNLDGMARAMPASWGDKLRELTAILENGIAAGDRKGNLELLRQRVFPFMSSYVNHTHDLGLSRSLLSLLTLDVARYENGSLENLLETFHRLSSYGTLKGQLGGIDDKALLNLLEKNGSFSKAGKAGPQEQTPAVRFAEHLSAAAARALRGEGSAEVQEIFQNLVKSMLVNESVYMPVNHFILPMEMDGRMLFSEFWVDPDAEDEEGRKGGGGRGTVSKFLFKLDIQSLGMFDIVLAHRDQEVDIRIACPSQVAPFSREIERAVSQILVDNGLKPVGVTVRKMERPVALTEVFPKIFEGKNSINVKV
ncbi:MAG: hypothetical protein HFF18_13595 [Oscillospiraceae bacterium]|nr:hypothetical protein [Oscillospiraceae bacterium]